MHTFWEGMAKKVSLTSFPAQQQSSKEQWDTSINWGLSFTFHESVRLGFIYKQKTSQKGIVSCFYYIRKSADKQETKLTSLLIFFILDGQTPSQSLKVSDYDHNTRVQPYIFKLHCIYSQELFSLWSHLWIAVVPFLLWLKTCIIVGTTI